MSNETSEDIASLAGRILNEEPREGDESLAFNALLEQAKRLAGSALSQRETDPDRPISSITAIRAICEEGTQAHGDEFYEPILKILDEEEGLGLNVNLIDVFSAWGEREAKDTAMLMDLCLGAAIEQLGGTAVRIEASRMESLAASGRIIRLQPEPNVWSVGLQPTEDSPIDYARAVEYSRGFDDPFDFLGVMYARENGRAPTYREVAVAGYPGLFEWVMEGFTNPPGENTPQKQNADSPLSADDSEPSGDPHPDSQDGFD